MVQNIIFMNSMNFGDIPENMIINFPQLQCLVGNSRSNLVNLMNPLDDHIMKYKSCEQKRCVCRVIS